MKTLIMLRVEDNHASTLDASFAKVLNRIRKGLQSSQDTQLLKTRVTKDICCHLDATYILYYNKAVSLHNDVLFKQFTFSKVETVAHDVVIGDCKSKY